MDGLVHVHGNQRLVGARPRELLDAADGLGAPERRRLHDPERFLHQLQVPRRAAHELGVAEDRLQLVVEVMGDPAGQLSERGKLLGLEHLRFEAALQCDVAHDRERALQGAADADGRERDGEVGLGAVLPVDRDVEAVHRRAPRQQVPRRPVLASGEDVDDGPAERVVGLEAEDALRGRVPAPHPVRGIDRDDRIGR